MIIKKCSKCKSEKQSSFFCTNKKSKDGLQGWCRECINAARRKPPKNEETLIREKEERRHLKLEKKRQHYQKNKEKYRKTSTEHYKNNSEKYKQRAREWVINNRERHNSNCMQRYTSKMHAFPSWLSKDDKWLIQQFYDIAKIRTETTGVKYHVDHIVPLRGKIVCGLHVPWNLQVITASQNCSKRNFFV
jgi:hypothetical protein